MMRVHSLLVVSGMLLTGLLWSPSAEAQDLFSRERLSGVETQSSGNAKKLDGAELRKTLERGGHEIRKVHGEDVFEIEASEGEWTFPILIELSPDKSNIWCTVVLQEFAGPLENHAVRFAKLMALNGKYGNVFFKFDTETRMMMLVGSKSNQNLTPSAMDDMIGLLMSIASESDSLWKTNG